MTGRSLLRFVGSLALLLALIGCWQLLADAAIVPPVFLPGPDRAFAALLQQADDGTLAAATIGTIGRMLQGFCVASALGLALGIAIGLSPTARAYLEPSLEVLRPLPASAIIPVAILLLGLTKTMIVAVIAFGSLWPVLLGTIQGLKAIDPRLLEVARALELSKLTFIRSIALPNALPDIFAGLRLALTVSLILAVVTEMMSAEPGLGSTILLAARSFRSADLFSGIIMLGLVGYLANVLVQAAQGRLLRWQ